MAVDPKGPDLERFLSDDAESPVVMLNLLRFKPGGEPSHAEYARRIQPFLERAGVKVLFFGRGCPRSSPIPGRIGTRFCS
jgi:hypothetical protein